MTARYGGVMRIIFRPIRLRFRSIVATKPDAQMDPKSETCFFASPYEERGGAVRCRSAAPQASRAMAGLLHDHDGSFFQRRTGFFQHPFQSTDDVGSPSVVEPEQDDAYASLT